MKMLLAAFCCLSISAASGQKQAIDSIERIIPGQKDSVLIGSYNELTWLYRTVDPAKAIAAGKKAIALSQPLNYRKGIAQAYNDLGIIYYDKESFDTARNYYGLALDLRRKLGDELGMAKLYNKIAIIDQEQGKFAPALENNFRALAIFQKNNALQGVSYSLGNIGVLQQNLGRFDEALKYQKKSFDLKNQLGDKSGAVASLINMGNIYLIQKDFDRASKTYSKGIELCRQLGDKEYLSKSLNNLANLYLKQNKTQLAESYVREALSLRQEIEDTKGEVSSMDILSNVFIAQKKYAAADSLLHLALSTSLGVSNTGAQRGTVYQSMAVLYEKTNQPQKALEAYRLYSATKDSLYTDESSRKYAELEIAYRTLESEKMVADQQYELTRRNLMLGLALGTLGFVALLGYFMVRLSRSRAKARLTEEIARQQELSHQAIMEAEEEQRSRIAGDLHDGVGQLMSAAKMNLSSIEQEIQFGQPQQRHHFATAMQLVDDACVEVRTVSHLMMPGNLSSTSLDKAVGNFLTHIHQPNLIVDFHAEGFSGAPANTKVEYVLYRVIQECINNVIKHAGAGRIDLSLIRDTEGISATIEDNGKGFDVQKGVSQGGLGLANMRERIRLVGGHIEWDSQAGRGTVVSIFVPPAAPAGKSVAA